MHQNVTTKVEHYMESYLTFSFKKSHNHCMFLYIREISEEEASSCLLQTVAPSMRFILLFTAIFKVAFVVFCSIFSAPHHVRLPLLVRSGLRHFFRSDLIIFKTQPKKIKFSFGLSLFCFFFNNVCFECF